MFRGLCVVALMMSFVVRGQSPAPSCYPLPCILQNGCWCDHSLPHLNLNDLQTYGTCVACSEGYTGWDCGSRSTNCFNGGVWSEAHGCQCGPLFTGKKCEHHLCRTSNGVAPPSNTTNSCADKCAPGWSGVQCDICPTSVPANCTNGRGCTTDFAPVAEVTNYRLDCDVTSAELNEALSNGRRGAMGKMKVECSEFSTKAPTANCYGTLYRQEPNASFIDPFFRVEVFNCSLIPGVGFACTTTKAQCAPAPSNPMYYPSCNSSAAGQFLNAMDGNATFACTPGVGRTADCTFAQAQFRLLFPLSCVASACLK